MDPIYHDIQLDFSSSDIKRTVIKQASDNTHVLRIKLYNDNHELPINPAWQFIISAVKPDNTHILNQSNISVSDNTVSVTMTKQMLSASGTEKCELAIYNESQALYSDTFYIYVDPNVQDGSFAESTDEYNSIVDTMNKVNDMYNEVGEKKKEISETYDELKEAIDTTNNLIEENEKIKENEKGRQDAESKREQNEARRQADTETAIKNAETATGAANTAAEKAETAADDLQNKLDSHHFVLTEDKDTANGVTGLDSHAKVPLEELYDATTSSKGITQLTDSVTSESVTTAATPNSVKQAYDAVTKEVSRAEKAESDLKDTIDTNKPKWDDKYTRSEIDNKLSALETNIDWKEAVDTYADIAKAYPTPQDGWTVNVKDTDLTYRYNGSAWVAISANAIPKATNSVDGLLSKEDYAKYEEAYTQRHTHTNKAVLDKITQELLDNLSSGNNGAATRILPKSQVDTTQVGAIWYE